VYEALDHTGDLALRIGAPDFPGLVAEGVLGIAAFLFDGEPDRMAPRQQGRFRFSGIDREDALVQGLSEAQIELEGVRADGRRLRRSLEIKAVTYHNLEIRETEDGLETVVVLDV
jgi:SHS2 domain-containing protein